MRKTIFYWSPCLNPVGTVKSTLNSAVSTMRYSGDKFEVTLINSCGEWDPYLEYLDKTNIKVVNFKNKFFKYLPKKGYIKSRFSYLIIFFFCFIPLLKLLNRSKPDFLIAHLITSLPLIIMKFFKFKTKFILRISGMPKLNFFRKNFWKYISNDIYFVTCPSMELKLKLLEINLFNKNKLYFLPDAIIDINKFISQTKEKINNFDDFKKKRLIFAAGRLTKQKNFSYLIDEFASFCEKNEQFILLILGDGEEKKSLKKKIIEKKLQDKVYLIGYVDNVFKYFKKGEIFIVSSLWEDPGFVMIEAALSNLFVISSNCPNGPKEFLNHGKNGILFENNKIGELSKSLERYLVLKNKKKEKFEIKKNAMKYSKFRHQIQLQKLLNEEITKTK